MNSLKEKHTRELEDPDVRMQTLEKAVFRPPDSKIELPINKVSSSFDTEMSHFQLEDFAKRE